MLNFIIFSGSSLLGRTIGILFVSSFTIGKFLLSSVSVLVMFSSIGAFSITGSSCVIVSCSIGVSSLTSTFLFSSILGVSSLL